MENIGLTHPDEGETNPLRYYLTVIKHRLEIHFTEKGALALANVLKKQKEHLPKNFILPTQKEWGINGVLVTRGTNFFPVQLPNEQRMFRVEIPVHDKSKLEAVAQSLSIIFSHEFLLTHTMVKKGYVHPGTPVQLFSLETQYTVDQKFHGASLWLSISPQAARFLKKHPQGTPIPRARREMLHQWKSFSGKNNRESHHLYGAFAAHLREYGMISFVTLGSCACMGGMPEEVPDGRGFYIDSHNVDYTYQQINLLIGIACLWDWVRTSLEKRTA